GDVWDVVGVKLDQQAVVRPGTGDPVGDDVGDVDVNEAGSSGWGEGLERRHPVVEVGGDVPGHGAWRPGIGRGVKLPRLRNDAGIRRLDDQVEVGRGDAVPG